MHCRNLISFPHQLIIQTIARDRISRLLEITLFYLCRCRVIKNFSTIPNSKSLSIFHIRTSTCTILSNTPVSIIKSLKITYINRIIGNDLRISHHTIPFFLETMFSVYHIFSDIIHIKSSRSPGIFEGFEYLLTIYIQEPSLQLVIKNTKIVSSLLSPDKWLCIIVLPENGNTELRKCSSSLTNKIKLSSINQQIIITPLTISLEINLTIRHSICKHLCVRVQYSHITPPCTESPVGPLRIHVNIMCVHHVPHSSGNPGSPMTIRHGENIMLHFIFIHIRNNTVVDQNTDIGRIRIPVHNH